MGPRLSAARNHLLLTICSLHLVFAVASGALPHSEVSSPPEQPLTSIEQKHLRQQSPFAIGEGFEGTPSDWTEYIVWLVGVIGFFYYWMHPNARRNLYAVDAPRFADDGRRLQDGEEEYTEGETQDGEEGEDGVAGEGGINGTGEDMPVTSPHRGDQQVRSAHHKLD